jgi:serine protease Do
VAWLHGDPRYSLVQVTNAVYPGYSGAAAVNARGLLVGIVQGELGSPETLLGADGSERRGGGAGIVIPVETLAPVLRRLQAEGRVRYGFLGVQTRSLSIESLSEQGEQVPLGALVENVVRGSPAAAGGLRSGDLIVAFEGDRVEYPGQLARWVAGTDPGTSVELVWVRDEVRQSARFTLIEAPPGTATLAGPAPRAQAQGPAVADKIQELEQQILRLSHELEQLKKQTVRR